ncbi:MAG TPA: EI24 domain-containing protein [Polyangiaceae bacterium]|nr:EI24 domain-containing protein [Polyangiaceae bacterium]
MTQGSRFIKGARTLGSGFRILLSRPALWPWAAVPSLVFLALEAACIWGAIQRAAPWIEARVLSGEVFGHPIANRVAATGLSAIAVLLSAVLGWFLAALLTPMLSAPALERLVHGTTVSLGRAAPPPLGFWREFACGLRAWLFATLLVLPLMLLLTLLGMVVPGAAVVTVPLKILVSAFGLAWGLLDYPLTLRGMGARERSRRMRQHVPEVLGFATAFSLLFWLPCCGIVLLPVAVMASTVLVSDWESDAKIAVR